MRRLLALTLLTALAVPLAAQAPSLDAVRAIHLAGQADALGPDRKIGACLIEKLQALGPFTFPEKAEEADAIMTLESSIPKGSSRVLWGRSPEVKAKLTDKAGAQLWAGSNKYKKATTAWGASTDIECGLANGLANKLVKAISDAKPKR